jgi:hypothetical protein
MVQTISSPCTIARAKGWRIMAAIDLIAFAIEARHLELALSVVTGSRRLRARLPTVLSSSSVQRRSEFTVISQYYNW